MNYQYVFLLAHGNVMPMNFIPQKSGKNPRYAYAMCESILSYLVQHEPESDMRSYFSTVVRSILHICLYNVYEIFKNFIFKPLMEE